MKIKIIMASMLVPALMAMQDGSLKRSIAENEPTRSVKQKVDINSDDELKKEISAAASRNDFSTYFKLIDGVDREKLTALQLFQLFGYAMHCAAFYNNVEAIQKLHHLGVPVDSPDLQTDLAPLHLAAAAGSLEAIATLIRLGADVNACDEVDFRPLHCAALFGQAKAIALLLEHNAHNIPSDNVGLALHWACKFGNVDAVKILLELEIDLKIHDTTALHWAATGTKAQDYAKNFVPEKLAEKLVLTATDHCGVIDCLLQAGMSVDVKGEIDSTVLSGKSAREFEWYDGTPLHVAAAQGNLVIVRYLLEAGANVNACNSHDNAPLHYALMSGAPPKVVQYLVERGANVNAKTQNQVNALQMIRNEDPVYFQELFYFLVKSGANMYELPDKYHHWVNSKTASIMLRMMDLKGPNSRRQGGTTLLMESVMTGFHSGIADLLEDQRTDVNMQDDAGNTALHFAVTGMTKILAQTKLFILEPLLCHPKIKKYIQNGDGDTPFHLAVWQRYFHAIKLFLIHNTNTIHPLNKQNKSVGNLIEQSTPEIKAMVARVLGLKNVMREENNLLKRLPNELQAMVMNYAVQDV